MLFNSRLRYIANIMKITTLCGGTCFFIFYHIQQTRKSLNKVVNTDVLEREKRQPEYFYVVDSTKAHCLQQEEGSGINQTVGIGGRLMKFLKYSLLMKLLWICRNGNKDQISNALVQLAALKHNKSWDCCKFAQCLDENTAVLLARTHGADLRYFLAPPIHVRRAALKPVLLSFKLRDLIMRVNDINPHYCIQRFIQKYFLNVDEQDIHVLEADSVPSKPDNISEKDLCILCLDALYHHLQCFYVINYDEDLSTHNLVKNGLMPILAEAMLRYRGDPNFDLAVLKVLTVLSVHANLLTEFFQVGMIGELSRLLRTSDIRLYSSAAVCLANLSGEQCYRPGLYLLHPIYRTTRAPTCDILLIHGLRGGVFVTWRQRDQSYNQPLGLLDATSSPLNYVDPACLLPKSQPNYLDPELQDFVENMIESDNDALLADFEVVLHDIPVTALREPVSYETYLANNKRKALTEEQEDKCEYTYCWPKDWLPRDCTNLRILGLNYWTSLSEWFESCPSQKSDIAARAKQLLPVLTDAGVGTKNASVVWLAHSMGGLIVKQILVEAFLSGEKNIKNLSAKTKAVMFFSTPHRGSSLAAMPRPAAAVLWPSTDVRQLRENSPMLLELHEAFIHIANIYNWETVSFAESVPTLVSAFKVPLYLVKSQSADLGRGVFYQLPLDHLSICKPATRQSVLYATVLDVVRRASPKHGESEHFFLISLIETIVLLLSDKKSEIVLECTERKI